MIGSFTRAVMLSECGPLLPAPVEAPLPSRYHYE